MPDLRRLLRQQLESWHAAGVSGLCRSAPVVASEPGARVVPPASADVSRVSDGPVSPAPTIESPMPRPASRSTPKIKQPADVDSAPAEGPEPPSRPLGPAERNQALKVLADAVRNCTRCEELARTRTQTVFGVGNPSAKIVFVGEAPGADEDEQGEPFVGRSGQLLNQIIAACRLKRDDVYICNILKCRPPGNRTPGSEECGNCREYLDGQLTTIDPVYIVCWGTVAAQNLLQTDIPIGKLRGRFHQYGRAKVVCTYHPSYLLRFPPAKKDTWDDMKLLFADMGIDLTQKE
jgi:DNA polymerase